MRGLIFAMFYRYDLSLIQWDSFRTSRLAAAYVLQIQSQLDTTEFFFRLAAADDDDVEVLQIDTISAR